MLCPNCGKDNVEGSKFCGACGAKMPENLQAAEQNNESKPSAEFVQYEDGQYSDGQYSDGQYAPKQYSDVPSEQYIYDNQQYMQPQEQYGDVNAQYVPQEQYGDVSAQYVPVQEQYVYPNAVRKPRKSKKSGRKTAFFKRYGRLIALISAVVVVLIAVVAGVGSCMSKNKLDVSEYPLFYKSDGDLKYIYVGEKEGKILTTDSDAREAYIKVPSGGNKIFFAEEYSLGEFDLCYRKTNVKDPKKGTVIIERGVSNYYVTVDGKSVFYLKNNRLYVSDTKKSELIAKDVSQLLELSPDCRGVLYRAEDGELFYTEGKWTISVGGQDCKYYYFSDDGTKVFVVEYGVYGEDLSVCNTEKGAKPYEIGKDIETYVSDDNYDVFYYVSDNKLYYKQGTKKSIQIELDGQVEEIYTCLTGEETEYLASVYGDDTDSLYLLEGGTASLVLDDYSYSYEYPLQIVQSVDGDRETTYYRKGTELYEIELPENIGQMDIEGKYLYAIVDYNEDAVLCRYKIGKKGIDFSSPKEITDNVSYFILWGEKGSSLVIRHDDNALGVFDGSKYHEVTSDIADWYGYIDGKMVFCEDADSDGVGVLSRFNGRTSKVLEEDVYYHLVVMYENDLIYYVDDTDTLYRLKGFKKTEIDDDVYDVRHHLINAVLTNEMLKE